MEVKHPPSPSPYIQEEFSESKSPCNPIAACAALASLISKSSENTKILFAYKDVKRCIPPSYSTNDHSTMQLLNGNTPQNISFNHNSSTTKAEYSLGTEAENDIFVPKKESIVKELFPIEKTIKESETLDASCEAWKWESKNEKSSQEFAACVGKFVSSTTKKKKGLPKISSSAVKRSSSCEEMEIPFTNARRLTRSVVCQIKEKQTVETKNVVKEILSSNFQQNFSVQKRDLLADKETVVSVTDNGPGLTVSVKFKNQVDNRGIRENNVSEMRAKGQGMQALNNSRRLTRSAVHGKTKKNNEEPKGMEECSFSDCTKPYLKGNITSERKTPVMETEIFLPAVHEICSNPTAEGCKKEKISSSIKTTKKLKDNATSKEIHSQGIKRKSITSKKQELCFSPRLRFLPRTRSQNKS